MDAEAIDEFRGDVCLELRHLGYPELADAYGGVSDERAADDYELYDGDEVVAALGVSRRED